jgi:hypothetical protein
VEPIEEKGSKRVSVSATDAAFIELAVILASTKYKLNSTRK